MLQYHPPSQTVSASRAYDWTYVQSTTAEDRDYDMAMRMQYLGSGNIWVTGSRNMVHMVGAAERFVMKHFVLKAGRDTAFCYPPLPQSYAISAVPQYSGPLGAGPQPPLFYVWSGPGPLSAFFSANTTVLNPGLYGNYIVQATDSGACFSHRDTVSIRICDGVEELLAGEGGVAVYPNPVRSGGHVQLRLGERTAYLPQEEIRVELLSKEGRSVVTLYRGAFSGLSGMALKLPELPAGIYTVEVRGVASGRIIAGKLAVQ